MDVDPCRRDRHGYGAPRRSELSGGLYLLCWLLGSMLVAFLVLPLVALALTQSWASLAGVARMADVRDAIVLSLEARS